ncbi:MAG: hypothetical protein R3B93_19165 [Bacteroidia bacterium]
MKTIRLLFGMLIPVIVVFFSFPANLFAEEPHTPFLPPTLSSISPAYTIISSPTEGATYTAPTSITVSADVYSILEEHYFKINCPDDSLRRFKLGYNPNNIFAPKRDVTGNGGNTHLEFEVRTSSSGVQWDKIKVKVGTPQIPLDTYLPTGGPSLNTWTLVSIPMSVFTGTDFTQVAQVTLPYTRADSAYEIEFKNMVFTGGPEPFIWFGGTKFDNSHDGVALPGYPIDGGLNAELLTEPVSNVPTVVKVSFYANGQKFGEDISAPYSVPFQASIAGPHVFKTITEMSDGSSHVSEEVNVTINISDPGSYGSASTDIVLNSPANGATFIGPANIPTKAQVNFWGSPSTFEVISSGDTGAFKLGYNPNSLYDNPQNVLLSGISHLDVKLRYTSTSIDWTKAYIKIGDDELSVDNYLPSGGVSQNDWFIISIPLGDFTTADLSSISFMEFTSTSSNAFSMEIESVEFVESGGSNVFLWFGGSKVNNSYDGTPVGQTPDPGQFNVEKTTGSYIEKVSFYKDNTEVQDDDTYPFEIIWPGLDFGTYEFTAVAHYSDSTTKVTDVDTVVVDTAEEEIPFVSGNGLFGVLDSPEFRTRSQVKVNPSNGNVVIVWEEYTLETGLDIYMVILDQDHEPISVPSGYTSWPIRVHKDPLALLVDQKLEGVVIEETTGDIAIAWREFNVDRNAPDIMYRVFFNSGAPSFSYIAGEMLLYEMASNIHSDFIQIFFLEK